MKKTLFIALALLMGIASLQAAANNVRNGKFQVADGQYIKFAKGNLFYSGTSKSFDLPSSQYEARTTWNESTSKDWTGSWDLFGWGTSKYNSIYPYETSQNNSAYASEVPDNTDIVKGEYAEYDWGVHNIVTGDVKGTFYCPTAAEWEYILNGRPNAAKLRALACIPYGGMKRKGLLLFPDNWSTPLDLVIDTKATDYETNTLSLAKLAILEAAGAIFLPSAGYRYGTTYNEENDGLYWTGTTGANGKAKAVVLGTAPAIQERERCHGLAVRLIENNTYNCKTVKGEETVEDNTLEEYEWNGYKLTKSGNYTYTFLDVRAETDSIATLHLHMKDWTGIENVPTTKQSNVQKLVRNGQLYIIRDDKTFNAAGIQVK
ncbi:MAG: hypothetical protein IJQ95_00360 [Paludibacteraceae bacterium]|nr:hypothetical protein [Paludibacteraceae bacterium]